jgi:purine-binding chemotaxis protein CheW
MYMETKTVSQQSIISYLSFVIGGEHFAINVGKVINILEYTKITKVPKAPDYMSGIMNLRGEVLPVIDTNIKLGLGATQLTANTCILVLETTDGESDIKFGALVDSVQEVLELEDDKILPPPSIGEKYRSDFLTGVVRDEEKFIMLIDVNKLFTTNEIRQLVETKKEKKIKEE